MDTLRITVKALGNAARTLSQSQDVGAAATLRGALQLLRACASHDCALPECDGMSDCLLIWMSLQGYNLHLQMWWMQHYCC